MILPTDPQGGSTGEGADAASQLFAVTFPNQAQWSGNTCPKVPGCFPTGVADAVIFDQSGSCDLFVLGVHVTLATTSQSAPVKCDAQ